MMEIPFHFMILLASIAALESSEPSGQRSPVPPPLDQKAAEKEIRGAFHADYAAKGKEASQRLAEKLLQAAGDPQKSAAMRFVLLREARDIATRCGGFKTALAAVDAMSAAFQVDARPARKEVLVEASRTAQTPEDAKAVTTELLGLFTEAIRADDIDEAKKVLGLADAAARKAQDAGIIAGLGLLRSDLVDLAKMVKDFQAARRILSINDKNPEPNFKVGRYLGFFKGDWASGLAHLAMGSDPILIKLAQEDRSSPPEAAAQEALGNAWLQAAGKYSGPDAMALRLRGARWLVQAGGRKEGNDREKVLAALEAFGEEVPYPRLAWLGVKAPPGFIVARYNGQDARGWECSQTTWKFKGQIASDEPDLGSTKDKLIHSTLAAEWVRVAYEFQGVTGMWFRTPDSGEERGPGLNLDKDGRYNEIRRSLAPERWHTLIVDFHGHDARIRLDGESTAHRFSVSGPTHVVFKAARGPLRVRKLIAIGFNP